MNLHPFWECADRAHRLILQGHTVYQQFLCAKCGTKQTMDNANNFYKLGECEECHHTTNIEHDGCNYMVITGVPSWPPSDPL
jgi:hypothetical protein